ncbi:MAG TPA: Uma2 family endonuclease [Kofleriaceae bacterium]|nr:Uma2 family endonuclease [Kofleriaceae bacterium]
MAESFESQLVRSVAGSRVRRMKRVEYEQLVKDGFFGDERVELLFGVVVEMVPPSPQHEESLYRVRRYLERQLGERALVRNAAPFAASDDSEPQPDVFVHAPGEYWHAHPERALLVVEISRSSLAIDRRVKSVLYANGSADEYWIVSHDDDFVEVYRRPNGDSWGSITRHGRGESIAPLAFPDVLVPIDEILPPRAG